MKMVGKALAMVVLGVVLAVGVMYVVFPANEMEGPADPYLDVRRPVLGFLRSWGLVPDRGFFGDAYLPTRGGAEGGTTSPDGEFVCTSKMELDNEPVYRGAFWKVGSRLTYRTMEFAELWSTREALRLCYAKSGKRYVAGEGTIENGLVDRAGRHGEVSGFVPRGAAGYWVEEVDSNGDVRTLDSWGDIEPFWRD